LNTADLAGLLIGRSEGVASNLYGEREIFLRWLGDCVNLFGAEALQLHIFRGAAEY
jgi:hypothetical protein